MINLLLISLLASSVDPTPPAQTSTTTITIPRADAETLLRAARALPICEGDLAEAQEAQRRGDLWPALAVAGAAILGLVLGISVP